MDTPRQNTDRGSGYMNIVLTAIAALLGLLVLDRQGVTGVASPSAAHAQVSSTDDPLAAGQALVSASEQRKLMIAELKRMGTRLERIESKLSGVLSVKVTEMPASKPEGGK
ncbi:MAG: hypothetical protein ACKVU4_00200 [Phycisphaerales bacterium]